MKNKSKKKSTKFCPSSLYFSFEKIEIKRQRSSNNNYLIRNRVTGIIFEFDSFQLKLIFEWKNVIASIWRHFCTIESLVVSLVSWVIRHPVQSTANLIYGRSKKVRCLGKVERKNEEAQNYQSIREVSLINNKAREC